MKKPKLIKREQITEIEKNLAPPTNVTISRTVNVMKDWLQTRQQNTKQNARAAFANLFATTTDPCTEC